MRNTITRSFIKLVASCTVYNNGKLEESEIIIPCGYNTTDAAERYIRRNNLCTGKLVEVSKLDKVSKLLGMDESDFIRLASPVSERSKETRDAITKTINVKRGKLVYMTADRKIDEIIITIPSNLSKREMSAFIINATPKGGKPIELSDVENVPTLYALDENTFAENAREMTDHFHFKA